MGSPGSGLSSQSPRKGGPSRGAAAGGPVLKGAEKAALDKRVAQRVGFSLRTLLKLPKAHK